MSTELLKAFFGDLAAVHAWTAGGVQELFGSDELPLWVGDRDRPALDRLRAAIKQAECQADLLAAVQLFVYIALHSVLVTIDGGSASAEVGRIYLVDETGQSLGEGLHELFVDYLYE
jgi:hypothetical protein